MHIALFLHFYQPPVQKKDVIIRVVQESYAPIIDGLLKDPEGKITLNITGSLLLHLEKYGYDKLIDNIAVLVNRGQIELVGSSVHHAFLPKLPKDQIIRQIRLHEELLHKYFGNELKIRGFFPPEMAFTPQLGNIVQELGYEWIILDTYAKRGAHGYAPLYQNKKGMKFFFRNRLISYGLVTEELKNESMFIDMINRISQDRLYQVIGLDGETFGHHRPGYESILAKIYHSRKIKLHTISGLEDLDLKPYIIQPRKSSWTILDATRSVQQPFIRWNDPDNEIHHKQWQLTEMACKSPHDDKSQKRLDRALFSCQYWWACARPWWHVEMIEAGAHALLNTIIYSHATARYKHKAVDLYHDIVATAFEWMRTGKMQRRVDVEHEYLQIDKSKLRVNI